MACVVTDDSRGPASLSHGEAQGSGGKGPVAAKEADLTGCRGVPEGHGRVIAAAEQQGTRRVVSAWAVPLVADPGRVTPDLRRENPGG